MVKVAEEKWITTSKAAQMLGYSRSGFLKKFKGVLPCQIHENGQRRWLEMAIKLLVDGFKTGF